MARQISRHPLKTSGQTTVSLQRRARILYVSPGPKGPELFAETDVDDATRALDVRHSREFVVLGAGETAPAGSCFIGACPAAKGAHLVYELPGVKPQGL